ncbi:archease [Candidatus Woesearchaeota archaeon]|nr:archease [Candidatus Woesearchaeota archaeon]
MTFLNEQLEKRITVRAKTRENLLTNAIKEIIRVIYASHAPDPGKKTTEDEIEAEAEDFEDLAISILQKTIDLSKKKKILDISIDKLSESRILAKFTTQALDQTEMVKELGIVTYYGFELTQDKGTYEMKFHYD